MAKVLKERTVVKIPESKMAELRELVKADGMFESLYSDSGISKTTLRRVVKTGKARVGTVTEIFKAVKKIQSEIEGMFS